MNKEKKKKHIIDIMEKDEELGLYDIFNDEKRQGVKDLIDTHKQYFYCSDRLELDENERCVTQCDHCAGKHKQRLEKYSERFDNDKSEIGNPDTWGKRVVEEPKPIHEQIIDLCGGEERFKEIAGLKPKQETLEEAAENYGWRIKINTFSNPVKANDLANSAKQDFIEGAKWQQKRRYSEEDLFKILLDFVAFPHDHMEPRGSIIERYLKELKTK
jgi:hypothetical protein